jgi:hypothetical protein
MKTLKQILLISLSFRGLAVAALLLGASAQTSRAGSASPAGPGTDPSDFFTWDLISSGSGQRGMAFITFSNNGTFRGYQLLAAIPSGTNNVTVGRGGTGTGRNTGSGGNTNGTVENLLFGFGPIDGIWTRNSKGKIVGLFSEALNVTSIVTNYFASTNFFNLVNSQDNIESTNIVVFFTNGQASASVTISWPDPAPGFNQEYTLANTNFTTQVGSAESTNIVSFTGTANGTKHLTLLCSTSFGKVTFQGVQATKSVDLSGNWIGSRAVNGHPANEFFGLTSFQLDNPFPLELPDIANFPNMFFTTNGLGAGYTFSGIAMVSQQKKVGFMFMNSDGTARAMMGELKPTKFGTTAKTKGIEEPLNRVDFTATLQ